MRIAIAGGGTGGHLFPGIAVAEEFLKRDPHNRVIFIGTRRGIEHRLLKKMGYELKLIDVEGLKGKGWRTLIRSVYAIPKSMIESGRILADFRPDAVLGVGGYASGPAVLTARLMGIPTAIAEQNALAGITNRILGKFVDQIFLTYAQSKERFDVRKVRVTGNPVRAAFAARLNEAPKTSAFRQLLIFGGSQGAAAINRTVVAMLPMLKRIPDRIRVVHQTGERDLASVRQAYTQAGVEAEVQSFIVDMASVYAASDLIICRAGATSLAEITAAGKASVLIPFPYAANDHQTENALAMVRAGASVMIRESELSAEALYSLVETLLKDGERLQTMEKKSKALGRPGAAAEIVDVCLRLAAGKNKNR